MADYANANISVELNSEQPMTSVNHYKGESDDIILIIGGIHESEQSGVEVACWVREILDKLVRQGRKLPKTIRVIPDIDEARGAAAREMYRISGKGKGEDECKDAPPKPDSVIKAKYREVMNSDFLKFTRAEIENLLNQEAKAEINNKDTTKPKMDGELIAKFVHVRPNRMFPAPGTPRQWLGIDPKEELRKYEIRIKFEKFSLEMILSFSEDWNNISNALNFVPVVGSRLLDDLRFHPGLNLNNFSSEPPLDLIKDKVNIIRHKPITDLMDEIEEHRPIRIVSCHGMVRHKKEKYNRKNNNDFPGVFVDPRYNITINELEQFASKRMKIGSSITLDRIKFTSDKPGSAITKEGKDDDIIAQNLAKNVFENLANSEKKWLGYSNPVAGNWMQLNKDKEMVVHYHADTGTSNPAEEKRQAAGGQFRATGFSLGDWGPVRVSQSGTLSDETSARGIRLGAPVYTIEPPDYHPSGAFDLDLKLLVDVEVEKTAKTKPKGKGSSVEGAQISIKKNLTEAGTKLNWDICMTDGDRAAELRTFAEAIIEVICETKL